MFELRLGKLGLTLFVGGMSLLLFSMFLIGVVVGKHLEAYPDRYAQGILEMVSDRLFSSSPKSEKLVKTTFEARDMHMPTNEEESFGLTFYDTLGGKKGEVPVAEGGGASSKNTSRGIPPQAGMPALLPNEPAGRVLPPVSEGEGGLKKETLSTDKATGAMEGQKLPPSVAQASPSPKTTSPSGKDYFEIQAASYRERKKAEQMARKFTTLGLKPRIAMKELHGKGTWYRVIVDGFESREKAQQAADRMSEKVHGLRCVIRISGKNGNGG